jgi:hypothetical protein
MLQYGEYKPDIADYEGQSTKNILNVLPQGDGYGPFQAFTPYSKALPDARQYDRDIRRYRNEAVSAR